MRKLSQTGKHVGLVAALLVTVSGCSDNNLIGPENQLEVANNAGNFAFQVSDLVGVTQTLNYTWSNSGVAASVDLSNVVTGGTGTLTITDAQGNQVFTTGLSGSGSGESSIGSPGDWTIVVDLSDVSGTLNFSVQTLVDIQA